jgi:hypothetical protein
MGQFIHLYDELLFVETNSTREMTHRILRRWEIGVGLSWQAIPLRRWWILSLSIGVG